ncbi:hypothetical protein RCO27_11790 [Sphingosinicella sp. LHD-64]|uniref:DUF6932 family protein n=1 Tax=Sphingosinicella sp. LHD-64 TaxID=3072139 RepID=UPI0028105B31|nr:hypothetical protein [Sphingosinicella sp. LHD-64]MDQ8756908.1 hypothetical protein [Sphingosinicella sp. LHD-64]
MNDLDRSRMNPFASVSRQTFDEAERQGFPAFVGPVRESSPVNATPYLIRYEDFRTRAAHWPERNELAAALDRVKSHAERLSLVIDAIVIGGSFTELLKPSPKDVDCLMLYRRPGLVEATPANALNELQRSAKEERVDVRFIPIDGDPLILIKCLCYFTVLLSKDKRAKGNWDVRVIRGLMLLDCRS